MSQEKDDPFDLFEGTPWGEEGRHNKEDAVEPPPNTAYALIRDEIRKSTRQRQVAIGELQKTMNKLLAEPVYTPEVCDEIAKIRARLNMYYGGF